MHITRDSIDTSAGPSEWFTGNVYVDSIATPSGPSRLSASSVHFTPGARTAWHPGTSTTDADRSGSAMPLLMRSGISCPFCKQTTHRGYETGTSTRARADTRGAC
jgi:hypothetical protein